HPEHLAAHTLLQIGGLDNGRGVERVEEERDTLATQGPRLRIEVDRVAARDLFDEADDLHLWEPNQRCSLSSTTSTATWLLSTRSCRTRRPREPTPISSAVTSRRGRPGRARRSGGCADFRTQPGFAVTASAGCASPRQIGPKCWRRCLSTTPGWA